VYQRRRRRLFKCREVVMQRQTRIKRRPRRAAEVTPAEVPQAAAADTTDTQDLLERIDVLLEF
jgi:hypothetical protein